MELIIELSVNSYLWLKGHLFHESTENYCILLSRGLGELYIHDPGSGAEDCYEVVSPAYLW